jgi:hypothetical protein
MCPMKCSSDNCSSDIKMFTLTEKGKELVENS